MEFFHKVTRFPFMHTRKVWYGLSAALIIASFALVAVRGLNLGVDFTGGVTVETNFPQAPNIEQLRAALAKAGVQAAQVQAFGSSRDILVRLPPDPNVKGDQIGARVFEIFSTVDSGVKLQSTDVVGPQVGQELFVKGGWALFATLVLILIYVLFRFTPKLAFGAILAVLHDPICVVGFFALAQMTFDLTAIAAILAVIGYSLNDTVIVFDRIRERARTARKLSVAQVIDESINQTLSRTLMTKLVTLLVVLALLFFGGETLHAFSAALVIGILAGTYSSIYISAALALDFGLRTDDLLERKTTKPEEIDGLP
ncbi:MAG TPA: protein translocase subunit SecF [Steroidobacteraceae bacterium]|jgi:preprotein translocase subunit SecF|nr:protein translocase subunit SecF [Steroidobacteraceae bacterium]